MPAYFNRILAIVGAVLMNGVALPACAQDAALRATSPPILTLRDAIELTTNTNPKLAGQVHLLSAADSRRRQAAQRPAIELGADIENVLGTGSLGTFDDAEATLSLGTVIELGDKRANRMALADREKRALEARQYMERVDIIADVARRFVTVLHAQAELSLVRQNREEAGKLADITKERVAVAASTKSDSKNAEVGYARARLEELAADADLRAAWAALVTTWGGAPDSRGELAGNLLEIPEMVPFGDLMARLDANPDLAVLAADKASRAAALDVAQARESPDVAVNAGVRRLQSVREQAFVLSASIPLGSAGRAAPFVDEARQELAAVESEMLAQRDQLAARLFGVHAHMLAAWEAMNVLTKTGIPAAQLAVSESEVLFRSGRGSLFELTAARRQLLELRREAIDTARNFHLAVIDVERFTGVSMAVSTTLSTSQASAP